MDRRISNKEDWTGTEIGWTGRGISTPVGFWNHINGGLGSNSIPGLSLLSPMLELFQSNPAPSKDMDSNSREQKLRVEPDQLKILQFSLIPKSIYH